VWDWTLSLQLKIKNCLVVSSSEHTEIFESFVIPFIMIICLKHSHSLSLPLSLNAYPFQSISLNIFQTNESTKEIGISFIMSMISWQMIINFIIFLLLLLLQDWSHPMIKKHGNPSWSYYCYISMLLYNITYFKLLNIDICYLLYYYIKILIIPKLPTNLSYY